MGWVGVRWKHWRWRKWPAVRCFWRSNWLVVEGVNVEDRRSRIIPRFLAWEAAVGDAVYWDKTHWGKNRFGGESGSCFGIRIERCLLDVRMEYGIGTWLWGSGGGLGSHQHIPNRLLPDSMDCFCLFSSLLEPQHLITSTIYTICLIKLSFN